MAQSFTALEEKHGHAPSMASRLKTPYQPQVDGLRGLAILSVLADHFGLPLPPLLHFGPVGVRFFFVLTGYFITLSLCRLKNSLADSRGGSFLPICRYYFGRFIRIGPPFYLALVVGALYGIEEVRTNFFWLATFQTNNYIVHLGYWPGAISHFWSLAVQEQFYLFWPMVVLSLPRRWFLPAMVSFIFFGLAFRIGCIVTASNEVTRWVTIFGCLDSFAMGALVAHLKQAKLLEKIRQLAPVPTLAMALAAFSCFFLARALTYLPQENAFLAMAESFDAIFLAWLLCTTLGGIKNYFGHFLGWSPMVYLGRISYGIYVYHVFIIILVSPLLVPYGLSADLNAAGRITVLFLLTVMLASISWHVMEKPLIAWKDEWGKRPLRPAPEPEAALAWARAARF
jgi:peptidoglycan/LPS O-acetylase OafA/YrhL